MKKYVNGELVGMTKKEIEMHKKEQAIAQKESEKAEKKQALLDIESQMKALKTERDWLKELVEFWAEATGDTDRIDTIQAEIIELAKKRKKLIG